MVFRAFPLEARISDVLPLHVSINPFALRIFVLLIGVFALSTCQTNDQPRYQNATLPIEDRVNDLLRRMTPEEKFWQLFMIPGDLSDGKERYEHGIFRFQVAVRRN